jgi:hypothetical protein
MNLKSMVQLKSDNELLEMVYQVDKWNPEMLKQVELELKHRNIFPAALDEEFKKLIEQERLVLSAGKNASPFGLIIGWISVLGVLGILIGYNYTYSKVKSKYTNEIFFEYNDKSRSNGRLLFNTSLVLTILFIIYRLM